MIRSLTCNWVILESEIELFGKNYALFSRVFRTVKKKVNFVFYLIGPTDWVMSIFSRDLIVPLSTLFYH